MPEMKKCTKCGEEKPATTKCFYKKKDSLESSCKSCRLTQMKSRREQDIETSRASEREYVAKNKDRVYANTQKWVERNKDRMKAYQAEWHVQNRERRLKEAKEWNANNKEHKRKMTKLYEAKNRDKIRTRKRTYMAERTKNDPSFLVEQRYRARTREVIKSYKTTRSKRMLELLGCSAEELRAHLETQFKPGMSWDNYGEWHIDHKRPCASFDLTDPEQQKQCFHYSNLQPLWAHENISKGAKLLTKTP